MLYKAIILMTPPLCKARPILAFLCFFIFVNGVWAQGNYRIRRMSVSNGLSQGDVRCMVEDKNGFLWLGTRDGLNRYDGNKFLYYLPDAEDSASLAFNQITALTIDAAGRLWIGATDGISPHHRRDNRKSWSPG